MNNIQALVVGPSWKNIY